MERNLVERESSDANQEIILTNDAPARDIQEFQNLVGLLHIDPEDHLVYQTTRVKKVKAFIVAYRKLYL